MDTEPDTQRPHDRETSLLSRVGGTIVLVPILAVMWDQAEGHQGLFVIGALLAMGITVVGSVIPWSRLPRWTEIIAPLVAMLAVHLLVDATGGLDGGFGILGILPLLWISTYTTPREALIGLAAYATFVLVPLDRVVAGYPAADPLPVAFVWVACAGLCTTLIAGLMQVLYDRTSRLNRAMHVMRASQHSLVHDLRDPLMVIRNFAEMQREDLVEDGAEERRPRLVKQASLILAGALSMQRLVDDVLEISRAGERRVTREFVDPAELIREAADDTPGVAVEIGPMPALVEAHRVTVYRMFKNVFENASKYASVGGAPACVTVGSRTTPREWEFWVEDCGPGVAPEERHQIFEPWHRGANARVDGSGLGLSIVAAHAAAHDGRAWAEPAEPTGLRVNFSLAIPSPDRPGPTRGARLDR